MSSPWRDILWLQGARALSDRSWGYFLPVFIASISTSVENSAADATASAVSVTALLFAARALAGLILSPLFGRFWHADRALLFQQDIAHNIS